MSPTDSHAVPEAIFGIAAVVFAFAGLATMLGRRRTATKALVVALIAAAAAPVLIPHLSFSFVSLGSHQLGPATLILALLSYLAGWRFFGFVMAGTAFALLLAPPAPFSQAISLLILVPLALFVALLALIRILQAILARGYGETTASYVAATYILRLFDAITRRTRNDA